jgi:hypothetical protein
MEASMTLRKIVRGGAWLALLVVAMLQIALPIVSEPYLPLRPDQYQIRRAGSNEVAVAREQHRDFQVLVRHDLLTPIPLLWMGLATYMAVLVLWAVPGLTKPSPSRSS